jgi:hypothetical protein
MKAVDARKFPRPDKVALMTKVNTVKSSKAA